MSRVFSHSASTSSAVMRPQVHKETITVIYFGTMAAVIVSLCTRGLMTTKEVEAKRDKTQDIDNPLNPYVYEFKRL